MGGPLCLGAPIRRWAQRGKQGRCCLLSWQGAVSLSASTSVPWSSDWPGCRGECKQDTHTLVWLFPQLYLSSGGGRANGARACVHWCFAAFTRFAIVQRQSGAEWHLGSRSGVYSLSRVCVCAKSD